VSWPRMLLRRHVPNAKAIMGKKIGSYTGRPWRGGGGKTFPELYEGRKPGRKLGRGSSLGENGLSQRGVESGRLKEVGLHPGPLSGGSFWWRKKGGDIHRHL